MSRRIVSFPQLIDLPMFGKVLVVAIGCMLWPLRASCEYFVPTHLGGSLNYNYGYAQTVGTKSERSGMGLGIESSGYFWQPWFLTMSVGLNFGLTKSTSTSSNTTNAKTVGGNVDLTLFPESRFPTAMGFSVSDSRQDTQQSLLFAGQEYQTRRFYLRQSYTSRDGLFANAWYTRSASTTSTQPGESMDQSLGLQMRKRVSYHDLEFNADYYDSEPAGIGTKNSNYSLYFTHGYLPSAELGVNSALGLSQTKTSLGLAYGGTTKASFAQGSSTFYWRPESRPYFFSGGVRLASSSVGGGDSRSVSTNVAATYRLSQQISGSLALAVSAADSPGTQTLDSSLGGSLSYFSEQYAVLGFDYSWGGSASLSESNSRTDTNPSAASSPTTQSGSKSVQAASLSLSHRLGRHWNLGRTTSMNFSVSQGGGASESSVDREVNYSLSHGVSMGWSQQALGGTSSANVSFSDGRSMSPRGDSAYQVATANLARDQGISRLSSISGFITLQASRSNLTGQSATSLSNQANNEINRSASAAINYQHSRFLGVYNLLFTSQLLFPDLLGRNDANTQSTIDWNNSWSYRIGLLSLALTARATETGPGDRTTTVQFSAMRSF